MRSGAVVMAWNVFKFCTALRALGSLMILVVLGVVGASYYAVVVANYGPALFAGGFSWLRSLAVLVPFHILLVYGHEHFILSRGFGLLMKSQPPHAHEIERELGLLLWAYFSVVLTDPGSVPSNWKPAVDEEIAETAPLTGTEFSGNILNLQQPGPLTDTGSPKIRYCRKCNQLKPPRCHHCSVCGRCVLKMDHHCVWVVNCVGALNYKFFLLFLFYTFLETSLVTLSLFPHFIAFFKDVEMPGTPGTLATTFLAFVLNLAFALSVMGFLIMHLSLVMKNTTTIEAYEKKTTPNWEYDLGRKKNFEQVFGTDKKYWFIPAYSEEDLRRMPALQGFEYPTKSDLDTH